MGLSLANPPPLGGYPAERVRFGIVDSLPGMQSARLSQGIYHLENAPLRLISKTGPRFSRQRNPLGGPAAWWIESTLDRRQRSMWFPSPRTAALTDSAPIRTDMIPRSDFCLSLFFARFKIGI